MKLDHSFQPRQMRRLDAHNLIKILPRIHTMCNEYQTKSLEMIYSLTEQLLQFVH